MKIKSKERLDKLKIRQRFVNLKEIIKEPQTKKIILFTIVGVGLLFYPFSGALALDEAIPVGELHKTGFLKKFGEKVKMGCLSCHWFESLDRSNSPANKKSCCWS
jgi:hypothetical protein